MYKKTVFDNYANFNGRASRREYWTFVLMSIICFFLSGILFLIPFLGLMLFSGFLFVDNDTINCSYNQKDA
nr:DUF805 domain-containing protein [Flavobacterium humidisoli]